MQQPLDARVVEGRPDHVDLETDVLILGAGACGLVAALKAAAAGAETIVLERDPVPAGSTAMSSGFIPAPGTRFQEAIGVTDDTPARFLDDIQEKAKRRSQPVIADLATRTIAPALEWLADEAGLEWIVLDDFLYPGHTRHRMHAVPEKTGEALMGRLQQAVEAAGIPVVTDAFCDTLYRDAPGHIDAVALLRPDGSREIIRAKAVVLACNGYGGNPDLVARHIPEMADGLYYGHEGNTGSALLWGEEMQAQTAHLTAYQGHGSLAHPHGILISWALMMEGGIQVNLAGQRFSNEHGGYSEQAVNVLAQPDGVAWNVYDQRLHDFAMSFPDYQQAFQAGAVRVAQDVSSLAATLQVPEAALSETLAEVERLSKAETKEDATDRFGRSFAGHKGFSTPFHAVKVTGALFHTQGGLLVDDTARVLQADGEPFTNLLAGGGAACGVSGPEVSGYLSGNGLLTAVSLGFVAGTTAARLAGAS
ncbi:FAD-dependent oxidoreductase [Roseibium aestuarii]|uniref:FAD-dependent oxidoreductase n=1 Tax=Roseibium aestuarii TaxID=2600299 RepID=A0ABW4JVI4_9HYPH|nr:FAD-dependent oxidoreductase [Roseibium aestuarii]